jgi:hypothetical protein
MKELTELLGQLAAKLGTTVEKLWTVLLKQAPIGGTVDLVLCIGLVVFSVWFFRFVQGKTTKHEVTTSGGYTRNEAEWENEGAFMAWIGVGVIMLLTVICVCSETEMIIAAFFNPEYWALTKILSNVK